jgi:hypothetical protein
VNCTSGFLDRIRGAARASSVRASSAQYITHCERDEGDCARARVTPPAARFVDRRRVPDVSEGDNKIVILSNHYLSFAGGEPMPAGTAALP